MICLKYAQIRRIGHIGDGQQIRVWTQKNTETYAWSSSGGGAATGALFCVRG